MGVDFRSPNRALFLVEFHSSALARSRSGYPRRYARIHSDLRISFRVCSVSTSALRTLPFYLDKSSAVMSMYGSQRGLNSTVRRTGSRSDVNAPAYPYARSEVVVQQRGKNGYVQEFVETGQSHNFARQSISAGQV